MQDEVGLVTLCMSYASAGWVLLWVAGNCPNQSITIHVSDCYDPFEDMAAWFEAIAQNQLPAQFVIDEEGEYKLLLALPIVEDENDIEFQIYADDRPDFSSMVFRMRLNKRQLIEEFVYKFEIFVARYLNVEEWGEVAYGDGEDLRRLNLECLREYFGGG